MDNITAFGNSTNDDEFELFLKEYGLTRYTMHSKRCFELGVDREWLAEKMMKLPVDEDAQNILDNVYFAKVHYLLSNGYTLEDVLKLEGLRLANYVNLLKAGIDPEIAKVYMHIKNDTFVEQYALAGAPVELYERYTPRVTIAKIYEELVSNPGIDFHLDDFYKVLDNLDVDLVYKYVDNCRSNERSLELVFKFLVNNIELAKDKRVQNILQHKSISDFESNYYLIEQATDEQLDRISKISSSLVKSLGSELVKNYIKECMSHNSASNMNWLVDMYHRTRWIVYNDDKGVNCLIKANDFLKYEEYYRSILPLGSGFADFYTVKELNPSTIAIVRTSPYSHYYDGKLVLNKYTISMPIIDDVYEWAEDLVPKIRDYEYGIVIQQIAPLLVMASTNKGMWRSYLPIMSKINLQLIWGKASLVTSYGRALYDIIVAVTGKFPATSETILDTNIDVLGELLDMTELFTSTSKFLVKLQNLPKYSLVETEIAENGYVRIKLS